MLKLYNANETNFEHNGLGILKDATNAKVVEEQNGMFELEFTYMVDSFLYSNLDYDLIVKADASPNFLNQLFRIYYISKVLDGKVTVKSQHISYDLFDNFVEKVELENVTCEYALNQIFANCAEANNFIGHSDIVNTQSYSIECVSPYEAIKGTRGSIVDTFGLGAKLKRDNFNIHVLNTRGESNNVLIAYKKNITGFEASIDVQDVVTKIYPYAFIDVPNEENNTNEKVKITLTEKYVTSENASKYANEKIIPVDFSGDDVKSEEDLRVKSNKFFQNKKDIPITNYKVEFIELSKTENYKDYKMLETVNLDDEVIVRLIKFGVNATTRVVKTEYDPIQKRYISIELGQLVNHFKNDDRLDKIEDSIGDIRNNIGNIDTNVDDTKFPNTLPPTSILTANGLFATVQLEWTYEGKSYYEYEVYASQIQNFTADTTNYTNRIFTGKASSFLHEVKPSQTWYYKVRALNTHGNYTDFSIETFANTLKVSDATEYFESLAIKDSLIGDLKADRAWIGKFKGEDVDAKNLSVTDGNGKKTLEVDSFGNVNIKAKNLSMVVNDVEEDVATQTSVNVLSDEVNFKFENSGQVNELENSDFRKVNHRWITSGVGVVYENGTYGGEVPTNTSICINNCTNTTSYVRQNFYPKNTRMTKFSVSGWVHHFGCIDTIGEGYPMCHWYMDIRYKNGTSSYHNYDVRNYSLSNTWTLLQWDIDISPSDKGGIDYISFYVYKRNTSGTFRTTQLYLREGHVKSTWRPSSSETYSNTTTIDGQGVEVIHSNGDSSKMTSQGFKRHRSDGELKGDYHYLMMQGTVYCNSEQYVRINLPSDYHYKKINAVVAAACIGTGTDAHEKPEPLISFWAEVNAIASDSTWVEFYASTRQNRDGTVLTQHKGIKFAYWITA